MRVFRRGVLVDQWEDDNLVVDAAAMISAQNLGGSTTGNAIAVIGFGSNGAAAAPGNTGLSADAYIKAIDGVSFPAAPNQVAFQISLSQFEANGLTIAEFGLMTDGGTLFSRLVRGAPLVKDLSMAFAATWTISF